MMPAHHQRLYIAPIRSATAVMKALIDTSETTS